MMGPKRLRKNELIRLIRRTLRGEGAPEENDFIDKYYDYFDKEPQDPQLTTEEGRRKLESSIFKKIQKELTSENKGKVSSFHRGRYLRAAVIVALAGCGAVLWRLRSHSDPSYSHHPIAVHQDIAPGGNKAVLVLANGSNVILDSAHNGLLGTSGQSHFVKVKNGQLAYRDQHTNMVREEGKVQREIQYNTLSTPRGGQYQITLSDGTKVWLNSASSLRFPVAFDGRERVVKLTGEAYFEVIEDKDHSFRVLTPNMEVVDLGTHFNISAYPDEPEIKTTLLEGSVAVRKNGKEVTLKPGQQSIVTNQMKGGIEVENVNTEESVAWKNGYFSFHNTNIYEIMRRISRWYDVNVHLDDSLHVYLNGEISRNVNVSKVFEMLELTGELDFDIEGKKIFVKKAQ